MRTIEELVEKAEFVHCRISDVIIKEEQETLGITEEALMQRMFNALSVMKDAVQQGLCDEKSVSNLSGGLAKAYQMCNNRSSIFQGLSKSAVTYALATAEHNACMGRIVAAPTAGACGILPGVLLAAQETYGFTDMELVRALFHASGIGMVIAKNASISGAEGGCQAECGSASAMAASAMTELMGGSPRMCADACALSLKFIMGLVCDPVAGLVEVPCVKRNASGAMNALTAADMALCGIGSAIPADEVIEAMRNVGRLMHPSVKETSMGGLAATKTAREIEKRVAAQKG